MDSGCKFYIGGMNVNCVGIDVSKGKSMIAVMRPLGEMVIPPFEVGHTDAELCELSRRLGDLDGEIRVVMEATGNYHLPVASFLYDSKSAEYFYVDYAPESADYLKNRPVQASFTKIQQWILDNYGFKVGSIVRLRGQTRPRHPGPGYLHVPAAVRDQELPVSAG